MPRFLVSYLVLLLCYGPFSMRARAQVQGEVALRVTAADFSWTDETPQFTDSLAAAAYLQDWLATQRSKAYWEASVDSLYLTRPGQLRAVLHRGERYFWRELQPPANEEHRRWLRRSGFKPQRYSNRPLRPDDWSAVRDSTLVRAADAGYPFASIRLTDIDWRGEQSLSGRIELRTGPLIRVGAIRAPEAARLRNVFLERYLGLQTGEPYRERRVRRLASSLRQLPYVTMKAPPRIAFEDSLAFFDLPLERRPASRFDFVIGVLPNSAQTGNLLLTGELNGELQNGFGQGERIAVRFEQLRPQTQELELGLEYPFLLGLPFGFEGELDLYRRDTSFLNLNYQLAATYLREGNDRLSVFWQNRRTIVPGESAATEPTGRPASDTLGVARSFFGLQARRNRTDRRFSPRRGYATDLSVAAGTRRLLNPMANDTSSSSPGQLQLAASIDFYVTPLAGTVLYGGLRGAGLFTSGDLLPNEQYRIGGAKLLRGFDEQSIFARDYLIATAEFRLLLGGNAFLYGFVDAGRVNLRNRARPDLAIDYPIGFGVGVNFDTRAGVFGLSLALGKNNSIPLAESFSSPKLHFGYVSLF